MSDPIAVFDFDGTLTRRDSFPAFARFSLGWRRLLGAILYEAPWLVAWRLGLIPGGKAKERLFGRLFKGMPIVEFDRLGLEFASRIVRMEREDTVAILQRDVDEHVPVYIVTASIRNWVVPWATAYGVTDVIATEAEVDASGRLTGKFATPNCHGDEKPRRLTAVIGTLSGYDITAYGDSAGDDALLAAANRPHRV